MCHQHTELAVRRNPFHHEEIKFVACRHTFLGRDCIAGYVSGADIGKMKVARTQSVPDPDIPLGTFVSILIDA